MDKNTAASVDAKKRTERSKRKSSRHTKSKRDIMSSIVDSIDGLLQENLENMNPQILRQVQSSSANKLQNDHTLSWGTSEATSCSNEAVGILSNTENAAASALNNSVFEPTTPSDDTDSLPARDCTLKVCHQKRTTFAEILKEGDERILQDCVVQNVLTNRRTGPSAQSQKTNDHFCDVDFNLSGLNAGRKETISKHPTGRVSRHLPVVDEDHNDITSQSTGTDGYFSQSTRCTDSTDSSTALGGSDTSAFSESTCLGVHKEKRGKKTGKKNRRKKFDLLLDGLISEDVIPEVQSILEIGTEIDVTLGTVGSADVARGGLGDRESCGTTERTASSPPPANSAISSSSILDRCGLEKSAKKRNAVTSSGMKSKLVDKTPVISFAGILKSNDKLLKYGGIQRDSNDVNIASSLPRTQKTNNDSHMFGKNRKEVAVSSDGVTSAVTVNLRFKDASVQAEASSHSDASVQVNLCQCSCMTRGKALGQENLTGTLTGNSVDAVVQQLRLSSLSDSPVVWGSGTPIGRPSLYISAAENLPVSSATSESTLSPIMQNFSLQVSMSGDEVSYCGNPESDLPTASAGKMKDLVSLNESHDGDRCLGGQLKTVEYSEAVNAKNSDSCVAKRLGEISNKTHKFDGARTLFVMTDDDETPEKSNLVSHDPFNHQDSSSSSETTSSRRVTGEVLHSTCLDRDERATGATSSDQRFFSEESPIESGLPTDRRRRSRGWKRVSMCAMNFKERRRRSSRNDSGQKPGSLSVVPDSDESFRTAADQDEDATAAKALE